MLSQRSNQFSSTPMSSLSCNCCLLITDTGSYTEEYEFSTFHIGYWFSKWKIFIIVQMFLHTFWDENSKLRNPLIYRQNGMQRNTECQLY